MNSFLAEGQEACGGEGHETFSDGAGNGWPIENRQFAARAANRRRQPMFKRHRDPPTLKSRLRTFQMICGPRNDEDFRTGKIFVTSRAPEFSATNLLEGTKPALGGGSQKKTSFHEGTCSNYENFVSVPTKNIISRNSKNSSSVSKYLLFIST